MPYVLYLVTAFIINLFFGAWRVNTNKYHWQWFAAIHLPIPFIIIIRTSFDLTVWMIPAGILFSLVGQIIGGILYGLYKPSKAP